ncbi:hypothetical protein HHI36_019141 [Cryptolaemus montrouzieri]|uniref:RING-type E3 ubiquitin transferase n=1 Tax=Cryptolaemus montrouzieri TaxID=559131 RepID=A0ABD2P213_9CUCU
MAELVKNFLNKTNSKENREMLCNICNKYLSVPPILCNKLVGNICGRCEESTEVTKIKKLKNINSTMERQKVFECVSKYLTFPCSFRVNGCVAELKWGAVRAHEQNCSFQNTVCPFSNVQYLENDEEPCIWIGKSTELVSHFSRRHKNYFMNNFRVVLGIESSSIFGTLLV